MTRYADHHERGVLLLQHATDLSDVDYWLAVAKVWQDCDRQPLTCAHWRDLWESQRPGRHALMTAAERAKLDALPERVAVYRGVNARNERRGLSWTLDRERAEWFARRFVDDGWPGGLIAGTVRRERILAVFDDRGENEAVAFPRYVYARKYRSLGDDPFGRRSL